jgi:AraC-like DNA-binding protein
VIGLSVDCKNRTGNRIVLGRSGFGLPKRRLLAVPLRCRAAGLLRRKPHLPIRRLAARLDISERHLLRTFQAMFGIAPKQFARIARIERVLSARAQGAAWAEIAYATGFNDQAHMINDFTKIVGVTPVQFVGRS